MKTYLFRDILAACGGQYYGDAALLSEAASNIVIDSRKAAPGALYVPIIGDNHDGHAFIAAARANGAALVLSDRPLDIEPYIRVDDTRRALQAIASRYRDLFSIPFIGLTGSAGKTSTKEMVAAALSPRYNVLKTPANLNNETGVPLTLFLLEEQHEVAVIEMGTNHFGEIDLLSSIVKPDICLLINIGMAHIENFGSREGIFKGKTEMLRYKQPNGRVIVNGDDDLLATLDGALRYGLGVDCDVRAINVTDNGLDGMNFTICHAGDCVNAHVPSPGMHSVSNALAAVSVGLVLGMELSELAVGISGYASIKGRMDRHVTSRYTLIDDSYNANPTSMKAAIDVLEKLPGRRVCILGDMREMGEASAALHDEVGRYAANSGVDLILCVGADSERMFFGAHALAPERARYFGSQESLLAILPSLLLAGDTILVKASRGMKLEQTVEFILNQRRLVETFPIIHTNFIVKP